MAAKKKTAKKTTAKKGGKSSEGAKALEFARAYLRKKPSAAFAEIRDAAKKKKITLHPISYGRAKALEGLVKVSPYGSRKAAAKRGPGRPKGSTTKRSPGRPRKDSPVDSIEGLVSTLKTLQQERDDAVAALDRIRDVLDSI